MLNAEDDAQGHLKQVGARTEETKELKADDQQQQAARLCKSHSVVLLKFPPIERDKAQKKLASDGYTVLTNLPSASNQTPLIVVSYDGQYKAASTNSRRHVVNPQWVYQADTNAVSELTNYSFALKDLTFHVFGKASFNGKVEAEIEFWRKNLEAKI